MYAIAARNPNFPHLFYMPKFGTYMPKFGIHKPKLDLYMPKFGIENLSRRDRFFAGPFSSSGGHPRKKGRASGKRRKNGLQKKKQAAISARPPCFISRCTRSSNSVSLHIFFKN